MSKHKLSIDDCIGQIPEPLLNTEVNIEKLNFPLKIQLYFTDCQPDDPQNRYFRTSFPTNNALRDQFNIPPELYETMLQPK